MTKRTERPCALLLLLAAVTSISSCAANQNILHSGRETPAPIGNEIRPVAKEIDAMRTAGFAFIYLLRRPDAAKLGADDKNAIKVGTVNTNRRIAADEDRAVIIGSNSPIPPQNLSSLQSRFTVEDYSEPASSVINGNPTPIG